MNHLDTAWMNGIQYYLREKTPIVKGHVAYLDAPWAMGSICQAQIWPVDFASTYGDGNLRDCLSVVICDWNTPGMVFGKAARECSRAEVAREAWEQLKAHLNDEGTVRLSDDLLHSWSLDPGLVDRAGRLESEDPLVLPTVGAWPNRPEAGTAIPNLILAGDYVRGEAEVANMEAASDTGRRAANAILERSSSNETPASLSHIYRPPEWEPLKHVDETRYAAGQPNLFDTPAGVLVGML